VGHGVPACDGDGSNCELLANVDPARYGRAALSWLDRFIDERFPPLTEVALAASALAEPLSQKAVRPSGSSR
jgi:hypothetical protein